MSSFIGYSELFLGMLSVLFGIAALAVLWKQKKQYPANKFLRFLTVSYLFEFVTFLIWFGLLIVNFTFREPATWQGGSVNLLIMSGISIVLSTLASLYLILALHKLTGLSSSIAIKSILYSLGLLTLAILSVQYFVLPDFDTSDLPEITNLVFHLIRNLLELCYVLLVLWWSVKVPNAALRRIMRWISFVLLGRSAYSIIVIVVGKLGWMSDSLYDGLTMFKNVIFSAILIWFIGLVMKVLEAGNQSIRDAESTVELLEKRYKLTERECEIATLVLKGLSNKEIGDVLSIAEPTVKGHLSNIYRKTGIKNRTQLFSYALDD